MTISPCATARDPQTHRRSGGSGPGSHTPARVHSRARSGRRGIFSRAALLVAWILGGSLLGAAQADVLLRFVDSEGEHAQILVKGPYARMDIVNEGSGGAGFMLFNAMDRSLYIVDDTRGTYIPFNEAVIDAQMRAMNQMIDQMREEVQRLPPEARAEMETQLGLGLRSGPMAVQVRATQRQQTLGGLRCQEMEILVDGRTQSLACVAEAGELGVSGSDFDTVNALMGRLFELSRRALDAGGPLAQAMGSHVMPPLDGIPLEVRDSLDGVTTRLVGVSTDPISPDFFRVPSSYREQNPAY
jgi:hypothetical protein